MSLGYTLAKLYQIIQWHIVNEPYIIIQLLKSFLPSTTMLWNSKISKWPSRHGSLIKHWGKGRSIVSKWNMEMDPQQKATRMGNRRVGGWAFIKHTRVKTTPWRTPPPPPSPVLISLSCTFSVLAISTERAVTTCKLGFYALYIIIYS
jgi:hypothetical protein